MSTIPAVLKPPASLLLAWVGLAFVATIVSVFLHEDGHGVGALIDGIHVSTGFNRIGDPGKSPDDPDFRSTGAAGAFWSGLLGPVTTWTLAIVFTVWLYRLPGPGWGALVVGAMAVVNGLIRAIPMLGFLVPAVAGKLHVEDEVFWGIWQVANIFRPELASVGLSTLAETQPALLLSYPAVWLTPLFSLGVSLACLIPAYFRIYKIWGPALGQRLYRWAFGILPLVAYVAAGPVLNWLDRFVRINW